MRRTIVGAFSVTFCCGVLLSTGCGPDPKQQIAQLQEEKKALGDQLLEASEERDAAQAEAAELKQSNASLQSALAEAKQAPPPPAPAPAFAFVGALSAVDLGRVSRPELSAKAKAQADAIAATIKGKFAGRHVYVIGHTDSDPIRRTKWKDNLELSCQRAMAVARYLASKGVRKTHILPAGAGEHDPLGPNRTKADKAKNRRVEIYAGPKPSR
jgi:outer membrane protein OmpA-like peptidoglycan-associated protein